jgi:hypothetical protein
MHGVLTHPPGESFGPTSLRWSTLSAASRKEGEKKENSLTMIPGEGRSCLYVKRRPVGLLWRRGVFTM